MQRILVSFLLVVCVAVRAADKLEAYLTANGSLQLKSGKDEICGLAPALYEKGWKFAGVVGAHAGKDPTSRKFRIKTTAGAGVDGESEFSEDAGKIKCVYRLTPASDLQLNSLNVSANFAVQTLAGGRWTADDKSGVFPAELKEIQLFAGNVKSLKIEPARGSEFTLTFEQPTTVLLQDDRQWGPNFTLRIGPSGDLNLKKGATTTISFVISGPNALTLDYDRPVTITAGNDWIPLKLELDIEPNSALDFSKFGFHDAPAGKNGRVIARPDGEFAFEKTPDVAQRFYGVNFCFGANFLSHEEADRLTDRLMRLGYNAIRVHHHEGELVSGQANSTTLNPQKIEQLDYFIAACAKRGIYVTTDLFVSRPIPNKEIGIDKAGNVEMDTFKILVPVVPAAWENWKSFTTTLLTHENPYTKLRYADDPALAWLSMINEGMFGNFMDRIKKVPEWNAEWNKWLAKKYATRDALATAWKNELKDGEDPAKNSVALPDNIYGGGNRVYDCHLFFAETDRAMVSRMKAFLRDELGCKALVTNSNAWTNFLSDQTAREVYDYVDDHFYVDHPNFVEQPWRLPSKCDNKSPISGGASGGRSATFTRMFGKPFTITEYNYSGPGRFRGVGGILTGAMGALQGWNGVWRFAYSHNRESMFAPGRMDYFNMATDPLSQAAERASLCLFMRRDMKVAPHSVCLAATDNEIVAQKPMPRLAPNWHWAGWVTRVGTQIVDDKTAVKHTAVLGVGDDSRKAGGESTVAGASPYSVDGAKLTQILKDKNIIAADAPLDASKSVFKSETNEITIDAPRDMMILDTPRTNGGYAPVGQTITSADGAVKITIQEADATCWISSLDAQPIVSSKRLLVTHLTDLQNTNIRYAEQARQTLLDWGTLPHLVRNGKALVQVRLKDAAKAQIYGLSTGGKRAGEVKSSVNGDTLQFTADINGGADGARMLYEIVVE